MFVTQLRRLLEAADLVVVDGVEVDEPTRYLQQDLICLELADETRISLPDQAVTLDAYGACVAMTSERVACHFEFGRRRPIEVTDLADDNDVGEWVGLHYAKHFPSLCREDQEDMRLRYLHSHGIVAPAQQATAAPAAGPTGVPGLLDATRDATLYPALRALVRGEITRLTVRGARLTYPLEGEEVVLSDRERKRLEEVLAKACGQRSLRLAERARRGLEGQTALCLSAKASQALAAEMLALLANIGPHDVRRLPLPPASCARL